MDPSSSKEYDFEDAQIVDSNLTEEDIKVFQRKKAKASKATAPAAPKPDEANSGPVRFQAKRKVDDGKDKDEKVDKLEKSDSQSASAKSAKQQDSNYGAGLSKKKQRLSFDEDE